MEGYIEDIGLRTALNSFNESRAESNFFKCIDEVNSVNITQFFAILLTGFRSQ